MVRTRADGGATRASGSKAPRKNVAGPSSVRIAYAAADKGKGRENTGGNTYFPRETPDWQKPITSFFNRPPESRENSNAERQMDLDLVDAGTSSGSGSTSKDDLSD